MQALVWDGQHLRLETTYPTPQADETTAVVRVRLAGMCATDVQILQGYMGFQGVPGREFNLWLKAWRQWRMHYAQDH
jgi:threonine dehydrogenase-like Zn-dependent dehydrogenase